jgi:hypothetical protein
VSRRAPSAHPFAALAALLACLSTPAGAAQLDAPPEPPAPPASPYQARVRGHRPSPEWTQDRSFTSTRFWLLDPGNYELQTWVRTRVPHEVDGHRGPAELLLQVEAEIGLLPHVQLDVYENLNYNEDANGVRSLQQEGNQIELRIAIPSAYGELFANPVIYFEWHPRHAEPDRVELRLLLGGAPTRWFYLAVNPYVETNVEETELHTPVPAVSGAFFASRRFLADMEVGSTVAAGFRVTEGFRLSAELKIGGDMLGDPDNRLHFVWFLGPGFIVKPLPGRLRPYLKIMGTCLFAMPGTDAGAQQFEPLLIIGSQL